MLEVAWSHGTGYLLGLNAADLDDENVTLPESVESQTDKALANLGRVLARHGLARTDVVCIRVHLTQFQRFHKRVQRTFLSHFGAVDAPLHTYIGVTDLPRDALVAMDVVLSRASDR